MHTVTIEEARTHLDDLIREVQSGEQVIITRNNAAVACLNSAPVSQRQPSSRFPLFGILEGKIEMTSNFDEPLDEFRPYME